MQNRHTRSAIRKTAGPPPGTGNARTADLAAAAGRAPTRARMEDVARAAGVALVTVSRAINTPEKLAPKTLAAIRRAIETLGYVPNLTAGSLASNRSHIIGAVVPTLSNSLFGETIDGLASVLTPAGYHLMIAQNDYQPARTADLVDAFLGRGVDGILLTGTRHGRGVRERLQRAGIPVVETWEFTNRPIDMVAGFSNREAGRTVAAYLLGKGYGTIGYLGTGEERSAKRLKGYLDESRRLGHEAVHELVAAPSTIHDGERAFARLIARVPDLRAVFCSNDGMAIGALTQCRRMGLAVPTQMAVVGFSDTAIAQAYVPPLTSVEHQRKEIGICAGRMLLDRLRGRHDEPRAINLGFHIIERESS